MSKFRQIILFTLFTAFILNASFAASSISLNSQNNFENRLADIFGDEILICTNQNDSKFEIISISDFTRKLLEQNKDNLNYHKDIKISNDFSDYDIANYTSSYSLQNLHLARLSFKTQNKIFSAKALAKFSLSQAPPFKSHS